METEVITEEQFQANLGDQLNRRWGKLLGQNLIEIEQLKFQISQQVIQVQEMTKNEALLVETIDDLRKELHQAQCDMLAAQGKAIIDDAGTR